MSEERWTGIILVNELHFLALEEKIRLIEDPNPTILDKLPIKRIVGQSEVGEKPKIVTKDIELWERVTETRTFNLSYDYKSWDPEYSRFELQKYADKCVERGFTKLPITYLELQLDIFPETRNIYRISLRNRRIPRNSETLKTTLKTIKEYRKRYDLYPSIRSYDEEALNLWLGRLYCLELFAILRGDKYAKNANWRKAMNVTDRYIKSDHKLTGDFFPNLQKITGGLVAAAKKHYDTTEMGWQLDGLVFPR